MSPLNAAICTTTYLERQKCYGPDKKILFRKWLFDLEVKGQGLTKVITVHDTPPYGHAPTYQISLTYHERQKCYGPDKKILFNKQLFDLEVKGQGPMKVITVCNTPPYGHAPTYQISLTYLERNNYLILRSTVKVPTKVIMIRDTPPYGHASTCKISLTYLDRQKSYGPDKLRWEEAEEAEEKIRLKQYMSPFVRRGDIIKSIFKDYVDGRLCMHGGLLLVLPGKWVHRRLLVGFLFLDL
jgi:hypothetical protein